MPASKALPLFLLAGLFAPLGVIAPKALAPLLLAVALWRWALHWRDGHWRRPLRGAGAVLAGLIALWALLSGLWAMDGMAALATFAKLAGVLLATLILLDGLKRLEAGDKDPLRKTLVWSFAAAVALLGFETFSGAAGHDWLVWQGRPQDFDLTVLNRSGIVLLLAAWPTALVLWQQGRRRWALGALLAAFAVVMAGVSSSNQVAAVLALSGAVLAWFSGRRLPRVLALVIAAGVLAAPVLPSSWLAPKNLAPYFDEANYSALHRLHIWNFTAQRIADKPVMGWGLDAARRIPGGDTKLAGGGNVMNMHPHNAFLQIWLELGAVGAVLAAIFLAGLWLRAGAMPNRAARAAATGLLLSALTVANLSFGIWQTWWLAALALGGLVFVLALRINSK
ncbi:MAG: O-antigen ligase family protein [Alphaproteobacteria bacterium]|jgi:O-antigen ligase